jgi:hypothetical protein
MQDGEPAGDEHGAALDGDARQGPGGDLKVVLLLLGRLGRQTGGHNARVAFRAAPRQAWV